jgi:tetratricopeptide (TPR) repeat protein
MQIPSRRSVISHVGYRWSLLLLLPLLLVGCGPADPVAEIREFHAAGRFEESLEPLRDLLEDRGEDPEVHYLYGLALALSGRPSLALWPLRKAMESPEWIVPAALQLGAAELRTGNPGRAIEATGRVLEVEPEHTGALVLRAMARVHSRRDYEEALADAERALEIDPDDLEALIPRAVALLALERVEEAGAALDEIERRFREEELGLETEAKYCAVRASFAKEKGDAEAADRIYGECLERFPISFILVEDAIEFYDSQQSFDRSEEILREALAVAPEARPYRISLVLRLRAEGEEEAAERVLRDATEAEHPALAAHAWADLAGYYVDRGNVAEGVSAYERVLEMVPEPGPQTLFAYAEALVMAGRYAEALALADEMTVEPHRELVRGRVHLARGEPARALERFAEGLRLWPDNAVARYYAALAAEQIGDFDRAITEYRYSIRAGAGASDARLRLARLHAAEGAFALALEALRHDVDRQPGDLEMALLELEILARLGRPPARPIPHLDRLIRPPAVWGRAVAALAAGTRARSGPAAAAEVVRGADRLDLALPRNSPALRSLVVDLADAGKPDEALSLAEASVRARPDVAPFHAIRGLALAGRGAAAREVRAAYERTLELESENAHALSGLARLRAEAGDAEAALALFERAAAADPEDSSPAFASAELLISLGRHEAAEARLEDWLDRDPFDGRAALRLAELRAKRDAELERTLALARRAVRFGGGPRAEKLLERVDRSRGAADSKTAVSPQSAQAP